MVIAERLCGVEEIALLVLDLPVFRRLPDVLCPLQRFLADLGEGLVVKLTLAPLATFLLR